MVSRGRVHRPVANPLPSSAVAFGQERSLSISAQLVLLLLVHVALWTWVGVSSRSNFDAPGDMVEAYAWAQGWQWGYYKHPPLSAWIAGLWFSVVPESQFGYSLLAAINSAVGLAGLAVLAREFLPRPWVLLAVAVAALAPGITTLAMRFNANSILVSTWPWALALSVRLLHRGRPRDAVLCGLVWALALLGKYYSGVLLMSVLAAALWLPAWRARLMSAPMALALTTFVLCMAPHASWLLAQTQGPLQYAQAATGQQSHGASAMRALNFALAQGVFPLLACLALSRALVGPARLRALVAMAMAPLRPRSEPVWLLGVLPIALTMLATVLTDARTASVWGLAIAAGLALLVASRARDAGATLSLPRLWRTLAVIWVAIALLSPLWWQARAALDAPSVSEPREELALAVDALWQREVGKPVPWVSGTRALAASVAFYAPSHPHYWSLWNGRIETPWVDLGEVSAQGGVIVCEQADLSCQDLADSWSADRRQLDVAKSARGHDFAARHYVVYLLLPLSIDSLP